jgi:uncharacterized protein YgiM (DUF1202 family)
MTKRILTLFLLLALAGGLYFMQADGGEAQPTATARPPTATNAPSGCVVTTGFDAGTVNLRKCAGTSCEVIRVLTEGERLQVIATGAWMNVTTEDGVTGWLNSKYCKGK